MKSQSGFTLIEALVTSMLSALVAGGVLSSLYMTNTQIQDGGASLRLSQLQAVVSEQIHRSARQAAGVKDAYDPSGPLTTASTDPGISGLDQVIFCDSAGNTKAGYKLQSDGVFLELKYDSGSSSWLYYPFVVGTDTAKVYYSGSGFAILPRRRGVTFTLRHYRVEGGKNYDFPSITENVLCRNNTN